MKRAALVVLVLTGCTIDNPDYCPPDNFEACERAYLTARGWVKAPDLAGFEVVPIRDMVTPLDVTQPPPDLLPFYLTVVGSTCDGGAADPALSCFEGAQCVSVHRACRGDLDCCGGGIGHGAESLCYQGSCCVNFGSCAQDSDCCEGFTHCRSGHCAR